MEKGLSLLRFLLGLLSIWGCLVSCTEDPQYRLTASERSRADTIYLAQVDALNAYTDSICTVLNKSKLQGIVDSIITLRKKEAELLIERNRQADNIK